MGLTTSYKCLMKRVLIICVCIMMMLSIMTLISCDKKNSIVEGEVSTAIETYFFSFKVLSAKTMNTFAGKSPENPNSKFVVVKIETKNTSDKDIEMYSDNYQLQWGERGVEDGKYSNTLDALNDTCAPTACTLAPDETMLYNYVYEVPLDAIKFDIGFQEEFDDNTVGEVYYVKIEFNEDESKALSSRP